MAIDHFVPMRLEGGRFDSAVQGGEAGFPLDAIDELARYDRLVVEVAAALWRQENPGRQRLPRGFAATVQMRLTGLEAGSVKTVLAEMAPARPLSAPSWGPKARIAIAVALAAIAAGEPVPEDFPESAMQPLAGVARGLQDGETAVFENAGTEVRYTRADQQTIAKIVKDNRQANGTEVGRFTGILADAQTFRFRPRHGGVVAGKFFRANLYSEIHAATAPAEESPYVEITGAFQYDAKDRLVSIDDVTMVRTVAEADDPLGAEIRDLLGLPKGWLDGHGVPVEVRAIDWVVEFAKECEATAVEYPHVFPTVEGGVLLEEQIGAIRWSLEVEPDGQVSIVTAGSGQRPTYAEPSSVAEAARSLKEFRA